MLTLLRRASAVAPRSVARLALGGAAKPRWLHATSPKLAGVFKHQDTEINSADTPFEFSEESEEKIAFTLAKYPETKQGMQSAIMPILWIVQQQLDKAHHITPTTVVKGAVAFPAQGSGGWVPLAAMHKIADRLGCSHMDVYEVSTFFTMYNRKPQGKFHIQLCGTTPCMVCGAYDILDTIEAHLGIKAGGDTSGDGLFTLTEVECLGACVNAPMVQINDWFFEDLTPATTVKLLDDLKAGRPVKIGPQNERIHSEGPMGRTSLIGEASGPQCRDLSALGAAAAPK